MNTPHHDLYFYIEQARKIKNKDRRTYVLYLVVSRHLKRRMGLEAIELNLRIWESEDDMPKKITGWTMINARLTKADQKVFHDTVTKTNQPAQDLVIELLEQGYKVSISFVDDRASFVFTVTGPKGHKINAEKSMTSWSDDLEEAMCMGWYKVRHVFNDGVWTDDEDHGIWG